jgi:hypothetical protein
MDQLNTHSPASLYEAFPPEEAKRLADRLEIHHTPKHGSWLNMAEVEFSALTRDLPERVGGRLDLERHTAAWERRRNGAEITADWRFTTADARIKLRKLVWGSRCQAFIAGTPVRCVALRSAAER